jgi:predicted YcjX-like family ATPase
MKITDIEKLNQLVSRTDMTGNEKVDWLTDFIDKREEQLRIAVVSGSMANKAQMINALINTLVTNQNELGDYNSLRDNSLEKLDKLIKSIDI